MLGPDPSALYNPHKYPNLFRDVIEPSLFELILILDDLLDIVDIGEVDPHRFVELLRGFGEWLCA